jgi:maltose O-acetyltransferase
MKNLIGRGLKIGKNVTIQSEAYIDEEFPHLISIGGNSSISDNVRIMAHDNSFNKIVNGYTEIGKVVIKENCFIATGVYICPGVVIGPNAIIAAGSYINKDVPPNSCVAGVPARIYSKFDNFIENHRKEINERVVHNYNDINPLKYSEEIAKIVLESVKNNNAYVKGYRGRYAFTHNEPKK